MIRWGPQLKTRPRSVAWSRLERNMQLSSRVIQNVRQISKDQYRYGNTRAKILALES